MCEFHVAEIFESINGEGRRAGQPALFVRFTGCNLCCAYCDTRWANASDAPFTVYTAKQLTERIADSGLRLVTLTGGEPLIQPGIGELFDLLREQPKIRVEVETNGSVDVTPYLSERKTDNISFTLDYKTMASGMEDRMCRSNFRRVRPQDTVKFVVGSREDLDLARQVTTTYGLVEKKCGVYISPCFGKIDPADIVEYVVGHRMNGVNVQLQMHKYIWDPDRRGV